MIYLLLYSGGVDSVLCLKKLIDEGITPYIFHFWTKKLSKKHEKMIRKTARLLSPKSPFYVFKTETPNFSAFMDEIFIEDYVINLGKGNDMIPLQFADRVVIGYTKWIYTYKKTRLKWKLRQQEFIKAVQQRSLPFVFPLANYTRSQVDKEFSKLPNEIKQNTISSTRNYDFGGISVLPKFEKAYIGEKK